MLMLTHLLLAFSFNLSSLFFISDTKPPADHVTPISGVSFSQLNFHSYHKMSNRVKTGHSRGFTDNLWSAVCFGQCFVGSFCIWVLYFGTVKVIKWTGW